MAIPEGPSKACGLETAEMVGANGAPSRLGTEACLPRAVEGVPGWNGGALGLAERQGYFQRTENGSSGFGARKWKMENGKWKIGDRRWEFGDREIFFGPIYSDLVRFDPMGGEGFEVAGIGIGVVLGEEGGFTGDLLPERMF